MSNLPFEIYYGILVYIVPKFLVHIYQNLSFSYTLSDLGVNQSLECILHVLMLVFMFNVLYFLMLELGKLISISHDFLGFITLRHKMCFSNQFACCFPFFISVTFSYIF